MIQYVVEFEGEHGRTLKPMPGRRAAVDFARERSDPLPASVLVRDGRQRTLTTWPFFKGRLRTGMAFEPTLDRQPEPAIERACCCCHALSPARQMKVMSDDSGRVWVCGECWYAHYARGPWIGSP